jgi:MFS family permease
MAVTALPSAIDMEKPTNTTKPSVNIAIQDVDSEAAREHDGSHNKGVDTTAQAGVQQVQGIATVWSKTTRAVVYLLIWLVYLVMLMQQAVSASLMPYVASAFREHSLTPTISVLSSIFGGVCCLPTAKMLDVFGRPQGYVFSLFITTVGLIMMAATDNVRTYAAAQVFWTVGNNMALYTVNIFIADTTTLHNRILATWLAATPNLFVPWVGGPLAEAFLNGPGWQWYYGAFSVIVPVACAPLFVVLLINQRKARAQGLFVEQASSRGPGQSLLYYIREFDAVGLILLIAGLALLLLPFNLYAMQPLGWKSPLIICLLVFGVVLLVLFALWERMFAPVEFIPFTLLVDRNVVGSSVLGAVLFISYYSWFSFFTSFLQVVHDLSISEAGYVSQIYGVGGCVAGVAVGFMIHRTGYFKAITLYGALPVYSLFMGLLIYFRDASTGVGYIIMCMIFISFASGAIMAISPIPAMAAGAHQHIAVVVAIVSMFSSIGGAVGLTVASTIWQNVFPTKLMEYLPVEEQPNFLMIYGMLDVQLSYPPRSPARIAIQHAYADAQKMMTIVGTVVWVAGFAAVALWRNTDLKTVKQVRGYVI